MRVLIVCYHFPPHANPRAYRWGAIASHWARTGHEIDVVSAAAPGEVPEEPRLRVACPGSRALGRLRQASPAAGGGQTGGGSFRSLLVKAAKRLHDCTWKQVYWPDFACGWYRPAVRAALRWTRQTDYDALVTVANPFTCHLVGLALRRRLPTLPWLADFGDPFATQTADAVNNRLLYAGLNRRAERRVLRAATRVCVTTEETREEFLALCPDAQHKLEVIGPLFSLPEPPAGLRQEPATAGSERSLAFFGALYPTIRNPRELLKLYRRLIAAPGLADLKLDFYGCTKRCLDEFSPYADLLGSGIRLHGIVPREQTAGAMRRAHALVNLGNTTRCQLPSKLVEYVATGRPVLNLTPHADDISSRFLAGYPAAVSFTYDALASRPGAFQRLVSFLNAPPRAEQAAIDALVAPYRLQPVADAYRRQLQPAA